MYWVQRSLSNMTYRLRTHLRWFETSRSSKELVMSLYQPSEGVVQWSVWIHMSVDKSLLDSSLSKPRKHIHQSSFIRVSKVEWIRLVRISNRCRSIFAQEFLPGVKKQWTIKIQYDHCRTRRYIKESTQSKRGNVSDIRKIMGKFAAVIHLILGGLFDASASDYRLQQLSASRKCLNTHLLLPSLYFYILVDRCETSWYYARLSWIYHVEKLQSLANPHYTAVCTYLYLEAIKWQLGGAHTNFRSFSAYGRRMTHVPNEKLLFPNGGALIAVSTSLTDICRGKTLWHYLRAVVCMLPFASCPSYFGFSLTCEPLLSTLRGAAALTGDVR